MHGSCVLTQSQKYRIIYLFFNKIVKEYNKKMKPNEDEYIYTDNVDYAKTSNSSIWGTEESETVKLLEESVSGGRWLNLCAGDGRFNNQLLRLAGCVMVADIDKGALDKLVRITPDDIKNKLTTKVFNVVKPFPIGNRTFDGVFCVGTLHLFPKDIFRGILREMQGILTEDGKIIIDFATDIKRTFPDGSTWVVKNEPNYSFDEAQKFLEEAFSSYRVRMYSGKSIPEPVTLNRRTYLFTCKFIVLEAKKQ